MPAEIHVGDIGTAFRATIKNEKNEVVPVNTATELTMTFSKPDKSKFTKVSALYTNGTDGKIQYVTVANDLDIPGTWKVQGFVKMPDGKQWKSSIETFTVVPNL